MIKYLSCISVVMAVSIFVFMSPPKIEYSNYVWYGIKTNVHIPCDDQELSNVSLDDLVIDNKYNSTAFGFQIDTWEVTFGETGNTNIFFCDLVNERMCAVGFLKPGIGSTGFSVINGKWIPTVAPVVRICKSGDN